jgi:hypothetical protein
MANMHWGRKETIIFPPHGAIYSYGTVFFAVILTGLFVYLRFTFGNSPLQRFYTPIYIRSSVAGGVSASRKDKYRLVMIAARGIRPRPATDADAKDGNTPEPGTKPLPLALSQSALQAGYDLLYEDPERTYFDAPLSAYLKTAIYGGNSLFDIYQLPLSFGLGFLLLQLPFSIQKDIKRRKQMRYGRRLKGTERLTPKEFNRQVQGEGLGITWLGGNALRNATTLLILQFAQSISARSLFRKSGSRRLSCRPLCVVDFRIVGDGRRLLFLGCHFSGG